MLWCFDLPSCRDLKLHLPNMDAVEDSSRPSKKPRVALETEHLATLKASYLVHFSEWSKGKKKICQKLPGSVWKHVYKDFLEEQKKICTSQAIEFDWDKLPAARTLQDALKENIGSADTGESDMKGAEKVMLQSEQCLKDLKETDGHARRNMIKFRASLVAKGSKNDSSSSSADDAETQARSDITSRMTKSEVQARGVETLERIAEAMEENGKSTVELLQKHASISERKLSQSENRALYFADENRRKAELHTIDMKGKELANLAFLRDNKIISNDEFIEKARQLY